MPRRDDYDDEDDRPRRRGGAEFPPGVKAAGIIWIGYGILGLIAAVIIFVLAGAAAAQVGPGGAPIFCVPICYTFFALAFLFVGVQTVKGTAKSTLGNGIGSIIFGVLSLLGAAGALIQGGGTPAVVQGGISVLLGLALLTAGTLALMGKTQYEDWRASQGMARKKRPTQEERDFDEDRPKRRRREADDDEDDRPRRRRRDEDDE
jgi:hypothetical protein